MPVSVDMQYRLVKAFGDAGLSEVQNVGPECYANSQIVEKMAHDPQRLLELLNELTSLSLTEERARFKLSIAVDICLNSTSLV